MKCPSCHHPMTVVGSCVTTNEQVLITNYLCDHCLKRIVHTEPNPRYIPAPKVATPRFSKARHRGTEDPGYVPRACCTRCGEVLRGVTIDGMCELCAQDVA